MSKGMTNNTLNFAMPEALTIFQVSETYKSLQERDLSQPIELDFRQVEEIDGAGVQLLLSLNTELHKHGTTLKLNHVGEVVEEVFALFNLTFSENQATSR